MFYKQHLIALDSFLNEIEGSINRDRYDDLVGLSGDIFDIAVSANHAYFTLEKPELAAEELIVVGDEIDYFVDCTQYLRYLEKQ